MSLFTKYSLIPVPAVPSACLNPDNGNRYNQCINTPSFVIIFLQLEIFCHSKIDTLSIHRLKSWTHECKQQNKLVQGWPSYKHMWFLILIYQHCNFKCCMGLWVYICINMVNVEDPFCRLDGILSKQPRLDGQNTSCPPCFWSQTLPFWRWEAKFWTVYKMGLITNLPLWLIIQESS